MVTKKLLVEVSMHGYQNSNFLHFILTYWFARKNIDNTVIFVIMYITGTNQVHSITNYIVPLQYNNTVGIRLLDTPGNQMVHSSPIIE